LLCPHCRSRVRLSRRGRREQNGSEGEPPSVAATPTPTISNEPTSAETISFWASHSSPCPPSHCTPFPGATISATMLSMISKQPLTARMIATGNAKLQTPRRIPLNRKSNSRIGNASRNPNAPWAKTVVMIAGEMEKIFRPNSERHFLIGVMRADRVQNYECRQQDPGSVGKLQPSVGQREPADKNNQQNILQHPRLPIQRLNRRDDPDRRANRD